MTKPRIVCIVGATASGKTDISVRLAGMLHTEIISADSIQVYKKLDIGSAKPSVEERAGVVHHLMDCIEINSPNYSVSEYKRLAGNAIYDITSRGMLPLIVGGTGLYVNALTYPLFFAEVKADEALRERLRKTENNSPGALHEMLEKTDPITAKRLHKNDTKRIIRALEVYELSGKPLSAHGNDFKNESGAETEFSPLILGITMPRDLLYQRIEQRVDMMMSKGLLDETKMLMQLPSFSRELPAMQGLGYKQLISHLLDNDPETLEETVAKIKLETRHFAKRQLTWFRRDNRIRWFDATDYTDVTTLTGAMYNVIKEEGFC